MNIKELLESVELANSLQVNDRFDLELSEDTVIETAIVDILSDGIVIGLDQQAMAMLEEHGIELDVTEMDKSQPSHGRDGKISHSTYGSRDKKGSDYFKGKESPGKAITAKQAKKDALDILKKQGLTEAEYQGRNVSLGKPFLTPDGPKKRSVYVRKPNGKVVKVNFGDKKMKIKKSNPKRRKSFRARHRCANPGPRTSARYWSCRSW